VSGPLGPRVVHITGGEGDLARAIASAFAERGWEVRAPGREELDVTDAAAVERWFASAPVPDLLVLNAGIRADALSARMTIGEWDRVLDVCLRGAFLCARSASRRMLRPRSGHLVAIGSFSARSGPAGQANYAAAKAGLIGLVQSLARELGPAGIRANCVLPGWMETRMTRGVPEEVREAALREHVMGRFHTPAEVAEFLVALDALPAVSGQVFQLDSRISPWT